MKSHICFKAINLSPETQKQLLKMITLPFITYLLKVKFQPSHSGGSNYNTGQKLFSKSFKWYLKIRIQLKKYYVRPFIACSIFTSESCCSPGRGISIPWVPCATQNCLTHRQSALGGVLSRKSECQNFEFGT